jgi:hypothetical protein
MNWEDLPSKEVRKRLHKYLLIPTSLLAVASLDQCRGNLLGAIVVTFSLWVPWACFIQGYCDWRSNRRGETIDREPVISPKVIIGSLFVIAAILLVLCFVKTPTENMSAAYWALGILVTFMLIGCWWYASIKYLMTTSVENLKYNMRAVSRFAVGSAKITRKAIAYALSDKRKDE